MTVNPRSARLLQPQTFAWAALASCVASAAILGLMLDGYSHRLHPLALLGADGVPRAGWFALFGFGVPGLLNLVAAVRMRGRLPAPARWGARLGVWMLAISALAFALQGLWPLDARDLDGAGSRLHAAAWTLWWVAFVPGAALLAWGAAKDAVAARRAPFLAAAALLVLLLVALPQPLLAPALAQRAALALWLVSFVVLSRSAA